uniref:C-type lectin domain-containing protein n=1 Tax=Dicentrarchus labrax TaxID=13489 RepID=A0A8P4G0C1_DICLA
MWQTQTVFERRMGLCFLPSCFPRLYIFVEQPSTWAEAQSYCREKYTDLASVHNERHLAQLNTLLDNNPNVWIGLQADIEAWRWSLEDPRYYGEGEADFRKWAPDEPNGVGYNKLCVMMLASGEWADAVCTMAIDLICYNDTSSSFIFVNGPKTWKQAQSYCREEHYTDLASVRNQAENDQIENMNQTRSVWIGLYRDSWKWSDGSPTSFTYWNNNEPNGDYACAVIHNGRWEDCDCDTGLFFVCEIGDIYILVEKGKSWTEAQNYCREKYTDLASFDNEEAHNKVAMTPKYYSGHLWTGLYDDRNSWRWSLEKKDSNSEGEAEFRMWKPGEPSNERGYENCAGMAAGGKHIIMANTTTNISLMLPRAV